MPPEYTQLASSIRYGRTEYRIPNTDAKEDVHTTEFNSPYQSVGMGYVSVLCLLKFFLSLYKRLNRMVNGESLGIPLKEKMNVNANHFYAFFSLHFFTVDNKCDIKATLCFHVACETHFFNMMCRP